MKVHKDERGGGEGVGGREGEVGSKGERRRTRSMIAQSFGYSTDIKIKNNPYLASLEHISVIIRKCNKEPMVTFCHCYKLSYFGKCAYFLSQ